MEEDSLLKMLENQALAAVELKKNKKKSGIQKCTKQIVCHVEKIDSSKSVDIVLADASLIDLPSPPTKKQKTTMTMSSEFTLENASANSFALAKSLSSSVTYHANDSEKLSKMSSLSCGEEVRALASQLFIWSLEQERKSQLELVRLKKLEDAADAAENRATDEMQKAAIAEAKVIKLEKDTNAAATREEDLKKKNFFFGRTTPSGETAKVNAEAKWLSVGLNRRLEMVKAAGLDFKKCMFPYELKALELEEADDDEELDTRDAEPTCDDADPKKL